MDFEPDVQNVTLAPSETRKCVNVTIIDDKIVERMEPFEVIITFPPGQPALQIGEIVPSGMQINGTINIIDDDGELMWNEIQEDFTHLHSELNTLRGCCICRAFNDRSCTCVCRNVRLHQSMPAHAHVLDTG